MSEQKLPQKPQPLNVVFIGVCETGKTAILKRKIEGHFLANYEPTTEAEFYTYKSQRGNTLNITDISGAEIFEDSAYVNSSIKSANAVVFVIDPTQEKINIPNYIENELIKANQANNISSPKFCIALTKSDKEWKITPKEIKNHALDFLKEAPPIFCSAKTGEGIDDLFEKIETDALEQKEICEILAAELEQINLVSKSTENVTPKNQQISQQLTVDEVKFQRNFWIGASIAAGIAGAALGATLGFAVGGPIGAVIGGVVGTVLFAGLAVPGIVEYQQKLGKLSAELIDNPKEMVGKQPPTVSLHPTPHPSPVLSQWDPKLQPRNTPPTNINSKIPNGPR